MCRWNCWEWGSVNAQNDPPRQQMTTLQRLPQCCIDAAHQAWTANCTDNSILSCNSNPAGTVAQWSSLPICCQRPSHVYPRKHRHGLGPARCHHFQPDPAHDSHCGARTASLAQWSGPRFVRRHPSGSPVALAPGEVADLETDQRPVPGITWRRAWLSSALGLGHADAAGLPWRIGQRPATIVCGDLCRLVVP
ncbi:hypothetical protein D3C85_760350 [compost metagenome]